MKRIAPPSPRRDRVRVVVMGTGGVGRADAAGKPLRPYVIVSRSDRSLVKALLEAEVQAIASGEIGARRNYGRERGARDRSPQESTPRRSGAAARLRHPRKTSPAATLTEAHFTALRSPSPRDEQRS